jgi:predicted dithiol-disulfide oxidoreductase (DUF899 family)
MVAPDREPFMPNIVSTEEWLKARIALLAEEKAFTRAQEEINRKRRSLPWVKMSKPYVFDGPDGEESLADLFGGKSQLIVYYFMFAPENAQGCPHCSLRADGFNGINIHLKQRDVTMIAVSRAPFAKLDAYRKRMGWDFKWVSSGGADFNRDMNAYFSPDDIAAGRAFFNYEFQNPGALDREGHSVFVKDEKGDVYHTYSCFFRGNEPFNIHYHYLDICPKAATRMDAAPIGSGVTTNIDRRLKSSLVAVGIGGCSPKPMGRLFSARRAMHGVLS